MSCIPGTLASSCNTPRASSQLSSRRGTKRCLRGSSALPPVDGVGIASPRACCFVWPDAGFALRPSRPGWELMGQRDAICDPLKKKAFAMNAIRLAELWHCWKP
jgi:hypothetical protein